MKKQQFNWKGHYVSPSCESVDLKSREQILQTTNPGERWFDGGAGTYGEDEINNNGEY